MPLPRGILAAAPLLAALLAGCSLPAHLPAADEACDALATLEPAPPMDRAPLFAMPPAEAAQTLGQALGDPVTGDGETRDGSVFWPTRGGRIEHRPEGRAGAGFHHSGPDRVSLADGDAAVPTLEAFSAAAGLGPTDRVVVEVSDVPGDHGAVARVGRLLPAVDGMRIAAGSVEFREMEGAPDTVTFLAPWWVLPPAVVPVGTALAHADAWAACVHGEALVPPARSLAAGAPLLVEAGRLVYWTGVGNIERPFHPYCTPGMEVVVDAVTGAVLLAEDLPC